MHYYQFNIGDYRRDTVHLSLLEHGIYRNLIDSYYLNEAPLCEDHANLMRTHSVKSEEEKIAFENVLKDFFILTKKGYIHKKCDEQISKYNEKSEKARASAKLRWKAKAMRTHNESNANHKPITNNHKPIKDIESPKAPKFDFKKELINLGVDQKLVSDWMAVRRKKKAANTETALRGFLSQVEISGLSISDAVRKAAENSWCGFKAEWIKKVESKGEYSFMKNVEDF